MCCAGLRQNPPKEERPNSVAKASGGSACWNGSPACLTLGPTVPLVLVGGEKGAWELALGSERSGRQQRKGARVGVYVVAKDHAAEPKGAKSQAATTVDRCARLSWVEQ